ncbi:hypothetical protein PEX1_095000 [Penicillium expansum]|uniref:Uncharacterized protein n=1 Tax=Penicillium expansum TaxID=27334 RepID=A0A0A2IN91_PENEN|nr:hypothetical protein PEX2_006390 [Penicillium expansum]KGO41675.1 hypothetical protein PEXP_088990 [Penicillium expansum]KGO55994.1 hypothetical protein PEX2_006390 [Penicillium expansum]KGO56069.1 hypothetical protein PEX1_095000 [Penicillium expansum]
MVGLKKLLLVEKALSRPATSLGLEGCGIDQPYFHTAVDSPTQSHFEGGFPSGDSQSLDVAHHFDQIEKQFEDLHDRLERSTSSQSQVRPLSSHFVPQKPKNGRHIDLMDALFSTENNQTTTPVPLSPPASLYNEDVAERNMTRFLRIQCRNGLAKSGILSALYQEDVADRNIAKYSSPGRSLSHLSSRSSPAAPGRVQIPESQRRNARKRDPGKPSWASAENLRKKLSHDGSGTSSTRPQSQLGNCLKSQRSAPSLSADEDFVPQEDAPPTPVQRLGIPAAYKQGKRWSNTPLPDSPTIPIPMGDSKSAVEAPSVPRPPATIARSTQISLPPPKLTEPNSKKNARGLSINTQLAAKGRPKIAHRAIQPPTPSTSELKQGPSIAEVMNSPLPVSTPISPLKSSRFKPSDMMEFFTKAYKSIQGSHPTYETLQDAIVREVNSHEAFRRVPVPAPGPPFTPASDKNEFSNDFRLATTLHRSSSGKNRLMNKSSSKHKSTLESRRSISTSVGYDRLLRKVSGSPARRRHTDAPAPTPGFLAEFQPHEEPVITRPGSREPITYLDVLHASSEQQPISTSGCASPSVSRKRGRSQSIGNLTAMACSGSDVPFVPGTVYCMQAHSAPSSNSSHEDSDDDIIHLPNPSPPPRVQIEGVDENNIRYVIDAASPDEAQKLMYWPQQIRRGGASNPYGNSLSPLSRARMQLRGSRSVETY